MVTMKGSQLYRKIYGCLAGGAVGDALGKPFEGMHYKDVEKKYGKVTGFIDGVHTGDVTDDTRMEHLLIKATIAKKGRVTADDLADVWLKAPLNPEDFWLDTRAAFIKIRQGVPPRLAWEGNVVTGSGLMFMSPVGILNAGNPVQAVLDAREIASIQQPPLGADCAGVVAAAVAEAMKADATVDSVVKSVLIVSEKMSLYPEYGVRFRTETVGEAVEKAVSVARGYGDVFEVREALYNECLGYHAIDPVEVLALTFAMILVSNGDVEKALIGGANLGRDSDTISRLCGSICGALAGIEAVPRGLVERVEKACITEGKATPYMDKPLSMVAEELTDAVEAHVAQLESYINTFKKLL